VLTETKRKMALLQCASFALFAEWEFNGQYFKIICPVFNLLKHMLGSRAHFH
jgi:hypothetical protein